MQRRHWSFLVSNSILALFLGLMVYVTFIAFARQSGSTGLDMAHIQKIRYEAFQDSPIALTSPSVAPSSPPKEL